MQKSITQLEGVSHQQKKEGIARLSDLKLRIAELSELTNQVRKSFANLQQYHTEFKSGLVSCQSQVQEQIDNKRRENHSLRERIRLIEGASDGMQKKISFFHGQYECAVRERTTLRQATQQLEIQKSDLHGKLNELQTELDSMRLCQRSLELQLRTNQERFEDEKRTLSSQLTAKLVSCQNDFDQILHEKDKHEQLLITAILTESCKYCENPLSDPVAAVRQLCQQLAELSQTRSQYLESLDDLMSAQDLLGIDGGPNSLTRAVHKVQNELNDVKALNAKLRDGETSFKADRTKLQTELRVAEDHSAAANQWMIWARRIHSIVYSTRSNSLRTEELRSSLEEAIVLSVAHRSFLFKMGSLREQKKVLLEFDRVLLMEPARGAVGMTAVTLVLLAVRRMQQCAGCVPIGLGPSPPTGTAGRERATDDRKHRKADGRSLCSHFG
jgi:chromosome segregation ATPase